MHCAAADLGVEQRPGGDRGQRPDDGALELDHLVVRDRGRIGRPQLLAEVLAVVEGEDGERSARRGAGRDAADSPESKLGEGGHRAILPGSSDKALHGPARLS